MARAFSELVRCLERRLIDSEVEDFQADGNPLRAWEVWRRCRQAGLPVPEPVLAYLDGVAEKLLALSGRPPKRVGPAVQNALGLQRQGGRGSEISRYRAPERELALATDAQQLLDRPSAAGTRVSQEDAFARVAEKRGVSAETVRRAWRTHLRPR
jgi:hypothetical protein